MIILRYPAATAQTTEWADTLKDLCLAHKLEVDEQLEKPCLSHSGKSYSSPKEISAYLDQLAAEKNLWWYCACDWPKKK